MFTKHRRMEGSSTNQASVPKKVTNALIHPKVRELPIGQCGQNGLNHCMVLDAGKKQSDAFRIKFPWKKKLMIHPLGKHRKLPIGGAHMRDPPGVSLWIANARGVKVSNLHQ